MKRGVLVGCIVLPFVLIALVYGGLVRFREMSRPAQTVGEAPPARFTIAPGATVAEVGAALRTQGVIRSDDYFRWIGRESKLKPGVYRVAATQTPEEILARFVGGKVDTIKVTFPEGFTARQMAARLKKNGVIEDDAAFLKLVTESGDKIGGAGFPKNLEGYLFPDTYQFPAGSTPEEAARMLTDNFRERVMEGPWKRKPGIGRSLSEVLTVASMVEREAEVEEDRPLVAAVIFNRLNKGMRLQIDATVQYARGLHKERLLYSDLEIESPYNTYKNAGLPPGPICCPGLPSIEAALSPATTDALFYVDSGDGTGKHLFAKTYAEHQKNVALFRKRRAERKK